MAPAPAAALLRSLQELQVSHEYSDLKIYCNDDVLHGHKVIICPRAKFFARACSWGREQQPKDEVELGPEDDPQMIKLMMDYLYQLDYNDNTVVQVQVQEKRVEAVSLSPPRQLDSSIPAARSPSVGSSKAHSHSMIDEKVDPFAEEIVPVDEPVVEEDLALHVKIRKKKKKAVFGFTSEEEQLETAISLSSVPDSLPQRLVTNALMYAQADKYEVEGLKDMAAQKFAEAVKSHWNTPEFILAAELAFSTTPDHDFGLRDVVIKTLNNHRSLVGTEHVQNLLASDNKMGLAFICALLAIKAV